MATVPTNQLAFDANSLNGIKRLSRDNSPAALKAASQQFETVFMQMVLKSMRDATPQAGMFDSEQTKTFTGLLDQQLGMTLSTSRGGTGLAAIIEKQLGRQMAPAVVPSESSGFALEPQAGVLPLSTSLAATAGERFGIAQALDRYRAAAAAADRARGAASSAADGTTLPASLAALPAAKREFVQKVWPHAVQVSRETGIPAHFMVAQAALETGWGKSEIRRGDGAQSFNLFNIKAGGNWNGGAAKAMTTEYQNGAAVRENASFRAYGSYADAFRDYARLITGNARYAGAAGQTDARAFADGLQRGGYATDPAYASKLKRVIDGLASAGVVAGNA